MPDAGEVKAKVTIEYDGSGVDKAKEDLASLAEAAGSAGEGVSGAGEKLAQLGEQAGGASDGVAQLAENAASLEKPMQAGQTVVTELTDALGEHQAALEQASESYKALAEPLGTTVSMLENAGPPMLAISEHAQAAAEHLGPVGEQIAQLGDSLSQSVPLLPTFADSMRVVDSTLVSSGQGLSDFHENMAVFQDALQNPSPFSMIQQHLNETGQTWDDFTSSIGSDSVQMLHEMAGNADVTHQVLGGMASNAQSVGTAFSESADSTRTFTEQFNALGDVATDANKSLGETSAAIEEVGKATTSGGLAGWIEAGGLGSAGGFFGGLMMSMNAIAMPLMAVQMIGMAVQTVSQGIYNAAAVAEGPAAHSLGTFTGAIDTMAQSSAKAGQVFSESFGQQLVPTLDAMNSVSSQGGTGAMSFLGGWVGGIATLATTAGALIGGGAINLLGSGLTLGQQNNWGGALWDTGTRSIANIWANATGQPMPYPGPPPPDQTSIALVQQTTALQDQIASPAYPALLAAQAQASAMQQKAVIAQTAWNDSHVGGSTGPTDPLNNIIQAEMVRAGSGYQTRNGQLISTGTTYGGTPDPNAAYFYGLLGQAPYTNESAFASGCFPAGTRVRMASGGERAIETLRPGDQVIAHDSIQQRPTVVLARIVPPPKQTYELLFADGNTLTLTDSHPVATLQGWKSLSPAAAKEENPDLDVTALRIGDHVYTADDVTCELAAIEARDIVQVYNVTVDAPHTFYANGILVHNKTSMMTAGQDIGAQIMQNVADATIPSADLRGSNLMSSITANFTATDLSHTFTATVNWVGENLDKSFTAAASWVGEHLSNAFTGVATWAGEHLENAFQAVASWTGVDLNNAFEAVATWTATGLANTFVGIAEWIVSGGLQHTYEGVANWIESGGLQHTFVGIAIWLGDALEHVFTGKASWIGENLEHTFVGVANWIASGLQQTFYAAANIIPGFASGVQNFAGGPAVVGEGGSPEVVAYNGQYSLFNSAALVNLPAGSSVYSMQDMANYAFSGPLGQGVSSGGGISLGGIGGGGPQSVNVVVQIDGQAIVSAIGMPLAQNIRVASGMRGY